jgi:transcription antitermination factor NusG
MSVCRTLENKGYELFLPSYKTRRRWSDRFKELELALFPGYLFCRLSPEERTLPVLTTPGVRQLVGVGRQPVPIPDHEITAVQTIVKSGLLAKPFPFLRVGQWVRIKHGPLEDLEGYLIGSRKHCRFVVAVEMLQRSVGVEVDGAWLEQLSPPSRHLCAS